VPKPILCLSEQLSQYLEAFRGCFSKRQWKYFVIVLLGLIECEERKTMSGLLRMIGERVSLSGLSRFLSQWSWSPTKVTKTWQERFRQLMEPVVQAEHQRLREQQQKRRGRPKATVVTGYLIFDDSIHVKPKGRKMSGLGKHYSHSDGRVVIGHCMFAGLYVLLGHRCPLQVRMYRSKEICHQEGELFQSKIDMAAEEIEHFEPVKNTHTHVLIDSWYHCQRIRKAAQERNWEVSGGLKSNRKMRLLASDGHREWIKLSQYAAQLTPEDWQEVIWPSQQGGQKWYAHVINTWVHHLGPTLLMITCQDPKQPEHAIRYWGSTLLDLDAQSFIDIMAIRWNIETFFEYDKDLLGSDHYQVMSTQAILRFWTLTSCMLYFLDEQRAGLDITEITYGDARRKIQYEHRLRLLEWIETQFRSGATIDQVRYQLAI
jgi:hypothetical protein